MLPDEEIDLIEKNLGDGWNVRNLMYIHERCAYDVYSKEDDELCEPLNLISILNRLADPAPAEDSPYWELRDYFRMSKKTPISLTFEKIEKILGEPLDWEAYHYEAFWYDETPDRSSTMWEAEGFPFDMFTPTTPGYSLPDCWTSQGYQIKALYLERELVVFRKYVDNKSGVRIPQKLLRQRLPDKAIYKLERMFAEIIEEFGL